MTTADANLTGRRGRPWWVWLLGAAAVLAILGAVIVALAFGLTSGATKAADGFLATLRTQGPAAAYDAAAPQFRAVAPAAQWDAFARSSGLAANTGANWTSRQVENGTGRVSGTVTAS